MFFHALVLGKSHRCHRHRSRLCMAIAGKWARERDIHFITPTTRPRVNAIMVLRNNCSKRGCPGAQWNLQPRVAMFKAANIHIYI